MTYVELNDLSKAFGSTRALADVSLQVPAGEVHGLLGENGAGKSTLVKILSGIVRPDGGRVVVDGEEVPFGSPSGSRKAGVSTAFQELSLLPNLNVGQNLLLADLPRSPIGTVSPRRTRKKAQEILDRWGIGDVDPSALLGSLSLAQRQRVEIARTLDADPKLLILDEPTAALPDPEWLFDHIEDVRARGGAVLYISHRMNEIRRICDRGTVLRNGREVGRITRESFNEDEIIKMMVGRSLDVVFPPQTDQESAGESVLEVTGLHVGDSVRGVDLDLRQGEIVGVAGLEGQGQRELMYSLAGMEKVDAGTIKVEGTERTVRNPRAALGAGPGIALVPEERKSEGLLMDLTVRRNLTLPALSDFSTAGFVSSEREYKTAAAEASRMNISLRNVDRPITSLSGGNQQKVVLGRTFLTGAKCLLLFDPTRGIDAGTKIEIYDLIRKFTQDGGSVLFYSTEIPELIGLCQRVHVMYAGRVNRVCAGDDLREESIMAAAVGSEAEIRPPDSANLPVEES